MHLVLHLFVRPRFTRLPCATPGYLLYYVFSPAFCDVFRVHNVCAPALSYHRPIHTSDPPLCSLSASSAFSCLLLHFSVCLESLPSSCLLVSSPRCCVTLKHPKAIFVSNKTYHSTSYGPASTHVYATVQINLCRGDTLVSPVATVYVRWLFCNESGDVERPRRAGRCRIHGSAL